MPLPGLEFGLVQFDSHAISLAHMGDAQLELGRCGSLPFRHTENRKVRLYDVKGNDFCVVPETA